jgi:hypothetical protein
MATMRQRFNALAQILAAAERGQPLILDMGLGPEEVRFEVSQRASQGQIERAEKALGKALPQSYREFLLRWNGAVLYRTEYVSGCTIFGTDEVVERNRIWREYELLPRELDSNALIFVDWGDGDYIAFDTARQDTEGEYTVLDGDHNISPSEWNTICDTFEEWLARLIKADGERFWLGGSSGE